MNALDENEASVIRDSSFGRFVTLADKPTYSGRFGRYIMSRKLKVKKKHEIWILFAGRPVRFSLREFAIVTGLPCGPSPKTSKQMLKVSIAEQPYWPTLFGKLSSISVGSVIRILNKRTMTDPELRIKYACLALLASVLMPTTHNAKIMREHAEQIKDLAAFFKYPWGRLAFTMLMNSIKEKKKVSLSQKSVALKGFVLSLQLVMVEAVPALTEVVQLHTSSNSDEDDDKDEDNDAGVGKYSLSPSHARTLNEKGQVHVNYLISDDGVTDLDESSLSWSDDEEDSRVDYMVSLIHADYQFNSDMFEGGATSADVDRMRKEEEEFAKQEKSKRSSRTNKNGPVINPTSVLNITVNGINGEQLQQISNIIVSKVQDCLIEFEEKVNVKFEELNTSVSLMEYRMSKLVDTSLKTMGDVVVSRLISYLGESSNSVDTSKGDFVNGGISSQEPHLPSTHSQVKETFSNIINPLVSTCPPAQCPTNHPPSVAEASRVSSDVGLNTMANSESLHTTQGEGEAPPFPPPSFSLGLSQHEHEENRGCDVSNASEVHAGIASKEPLIPTTQNQAEDETPPFQPPSFSLGLSQLQQEEPRGCDVGNEEEVHAGGGDDGDDDENGFNGRGSKRIKTAPQMLVNDFQCDSRFLQVENEGQLCIRKCAILHEKIQRSWSMNVGGVSVSNKDIAEIASPSKSITLKMMDVLVHYTRDAYDRSSEGRVCKKAAFLDTKFTSLLGKHSPRFSKAKDVGAFQFQKQLVEMLNGDDESHADAERFYFPFNIDKQHWVTICADWPELEVQVLDCNVSFRKEHALEKDIKHIAAMFPYLLKQSGRELAQSDLEQFTIVRNPRIPENLIYVASGVTSILLMQTHAVAGLQGCFKVTPEYLTPACQKMAVSLYETYQESV